MNRKLLYLLLPFGFAPCLASMSLGGAQNMKDPNALNGKLIEAAASGSIGLITDLLKQGANVNGRGDNNGRTALQSAAYSGHLDCVEALIQAQALVNACDNHGITALHWAAEKGHIDCLKALIQAGADINAPDVSGRTALHWSAREGKLGSVKILIEAKADVNTRDNWRFTALHRAVGHADCVKALIEAKTHINLPNYMGDTALYLAASNGELDSVKTLVKYSYTLVPSEGAVSQSRKRISEFLFQLTLLRKHFPRVDNLKSESLHFEMLSWEALQEDLIIIYLDELRKGKEIKAIPLIRSKEAVARYLLKKVSEIVSSISLNSLPSAMATFLDPVNLKETLSALIKEGLDERIEKLKVKTAV